MSSLAYFLVRESEKLMGHWKLRLRNPRDASNPFLYSVAVFKVGDDLVYRAWDQKDFSQTEINDNVKAEFVFNIKTKTIFTETASIQNDADFFALWYAFIKYFQNLDVFFLQLDCPIYERLKPLFKDVWGMEPVPKRSDVLQTTIAKALIGFHKQPNCVLLP